jgi:hypothetical protein
MGLENGGAFHQTTSSISTEVLAVTRTLSWLETQTFANEYYLSDSMNMFRKIGTGWGYQ